MVLVVDMPLMLARRLFGMDEGTPAGPSLAIMLVAPWICGSWLLRSTATRWPWHWRQAPAVRGFGMALPVRRRHLALGVAVGLAVSLGLEPLLLAWWNPGPLPTHPMFAAAAGASMPLRGVVLLTACVAAPVVEELLFRGVLLTALLAYGRTALDTAPSRGRTLAAVAVVSVLFGLVHIGTYGNSVPTIALITLGAPALAWLRLHTRSLWPAIAAHATMNLVASIAWLAGS